MAHVKVYGTDECDDTQEARQHLEMLGVPYDFINVDASKPALAWVKQHNGGKRKTPTIQVDGEVLSVPTDAQLERTLRTTGVMS